MTMTADEQKRYEYMMTLTRADLLKFTRSIGVSAHAITTNEGLAEFLIVNLRHLRKSA